MSSSTSGERIVPCANAPPSRTFPGALTQCQSPSAIAEGLCVNRFGTVERAEAYCFTQVGRRSRVTSLTS